MYIRSLNVFAATHAVVAACLCIACTHDTPTSRMLPSSRILPTARIALQERRVPSFPLQPSPVPSSPTPVSSSPVQAALAPTHESLSVTPLEQYRQWISDAHVLYPYAESEDTMWAVMMCESSGNPESVGDSYYGLFQYSNATWSGDWNPYHEQPINDPHAQILATAKAWYEGHQQWWGCYPS